MQQEKHPGKFYGVRSKNWGKLTQLEGPVPDSSPGYCPADPNSTTSSAHVSTAKCTCGQAARSLLLQSSSETYYRNTPWQNKNLLPLCMDAHPQEGETVSFLTQRQTYFKSCDPVLSCQHYARDKQNSSYHRFLSYIGRTWRTTKQKGNRILAAN